MSIIKYDNDVLTHGGQTSVSGFIDEIKSILEYIKSLDELTVYAGVHGKEDGTFSHNFSQSEIEATEQMASSLPNVKLQMLKNKILDKEQMNSACETGKVFFTWCDSETTLTTLYSIKLKGKEVIAE